MKKIIQLPHTSLLYCRLYYLDYKIVLGKRKIRNRYYNMAEYFTYKDMKVFLERDKIFSFSEKIDILNKCYDIQTGKRA